MKQQWGHLCRVKLPTHVLHYKGERESQRPGTYIACALRKLTYFSAMKINTRFIQWTKFHRVLSYKQVTPPNDQALGLMPINIPARGVNLGFLIDLGVEHLKYDRFKMYIDQGVHFQIIINKAVLHVYSLSPVCKTKCFEMRPTQLISHKIYFTAWKCTYWVSAHHSNVLIFSFLGMGRNEWPSSWEIRKQQTRDVYWILAS